MIVDTSAAALSSGGRPHRSTDCSLLSNSRQFKAVLQVLGDQMTYADPVRHRPKHCIPERQSVIFHRIERRRKIVTLGALHRQHRSPRVDRRSDLVDPYSRLGIATLLNSASVACTIPSAFHV